MVVVENATGAFPSAPVEARPVTIWSDGVPLVGSVFLPERAAAGRSPAVVLCHGWGGVRDHLDGTYAQWFSRHGLACVTFDYRGWGESPGELVAPTLGDDGAPRERRQVVDPVAQIEDIGAALDFAAGQEGVDADRMGIWGTSFGAGLSLCVTATDERVRAFVGQIGCYGVPRTEEFNRLARQRAIEKACGLGPGPVRDMLQGRAPQDADAIAIVKAEAAAIFPRSAAEGLEGMADLARLGGYQPRDLAAMVAVPTLVIDAEDDEYYEVRAHGRAVYEAVQGRAPAEYLSYPCTHYEVYRGPHYFSACNAAMEWFLAHL